MNGSLDKLLFLYKFILFPRQIGSITPSSARLAKKMMEPIPWHKVQYAAELGAGTGAVTQYISRAANKNTKVLLFEKDRQLREWLIARFPNFPCYTDASMLQAAMRKEGIAQLDCIISGLPFFNFPPQLQERLLREIAASLKPGGWFVAFQYSRQLKKRLKAYFEIERIRLVLLNVPPAHIYVCRKKAERTEG